MSSAAPVTVERFRHEAVLYAGMDGFLEQMVPFLQEGVAAGEPALVVVSGSKIEALRQALGRHADHIEFAEMSSVGANPARIIPAWRDFVDAHAGDGRRLRGIGEPIYPERSATELVECVRHEALLNVAFDDGPPWWLACPYDLQALPAAVIEEAQRTHPYVGHAQAHTQSREYRGGLAAAPWAAPLPEPPAVDINLRIDAGTLSLARGAVARAAARARFTSEPISDLVQAVNEVATNSLQHGGGAADVRIWRDGATLVCELRDRGHFVDPLVDRRRPEPGRDGGRGLWMANQLCDLVQLRSFPEGTVVRLHKHHDRSH
jgi:anti-sigma regulatory factor (Ser/Thr protein kinase)